MQFARSAIALNPRKFGRGPVRTIADEPTAAPLLPSVPEEVKLFATTFIAGFLFVSILIG